jgi:hypothetical protein
MYLKELIKVRLHGRESQEPVERLIWWHELQDRDDISTTRAQSARDELIR